MASHSSPSSGPFTVSGIQLALQLGWPRVSALTAHLARVSSLSGPAPAGILPIVTGPTRRGDGLLPACSRCLSAAGIRYCGHPAPARNSAPLAIGLPPGGRLPQEDHDGLQRFRTPEMRPDWVPSLSRDQRCSHGP